MNFPPFHIVLPATKLAVGASGSTMIDLWNGTTDLLLRVRSARVFPDIISAITGTRVLFRLQRTTAVGTGGDAITPLAFDTGAEVLKAAVSCRSLPTGGATLGSTLGVVNFDPDETGLAAAHIGGSGDLGELLPLAVRQGPGLVLRPSAGCAIVGEGSSLSANVWCVVVFSAEPLRLNS
jgi:hypothetical protein